MILQITALSLLFTLIKIQQHTPCSTIQYKQIKHLGQLWVFYTWHVTIYMDIIA